MSNLLKFLLSPVFCLLLLKAELEAKNLWHLSRITHGFDAPIEEYPYMVNIWLSHRYHCGGTLVTTKCVLTAAHCLQAIGHVQNLRIFGSIKSRNQVKAFESRAVQALVPDTYVPPRKPEYDELNAKYLCQCHRYRRSAGYTFTTTLNEGTTTRQYIENSRDPQLDIGIIVLEDRLSSREVSLIQIDDDEVEAGDNVTIAGWSPAGHADTPTDNLQAVNSSVTPDFLCSFFWREEVDMLHKFCIDEDNEQRPCSHDIGGPAIRNGKQVGIIANINPCADRQAPSVYTRLSSKAVQRFLRKNLDAYC